MAVNEVRGMRGMSVGLVQNERKDDVLDFCAACLPSEIWTKPFLSASYYTKLMAITIGYGQRRLFTRIGLGVGTILLLRALFSGSSGPPHAIVQHSVLERVTLADKTLDVQRHPFLQARMGRDERDDLLMGWLRNGVNDYWNRFQLPL